MLIAFVSLAVAGNALARPALRGGADRLGWLF
jgi:hypothetical protein